MDLKTSECSALESAEDNEGIATPEKPAIVEGNKIENNGSCGGEYDDENLLVDSKSKVVGDIKAVILPRLIGNSPLSVISPGSVADSPGGVVGASSPTVTKGYGLKKWRRIRREFSKDGSGKEDISRILKRGLSTSVVNSSKPRGVSIETRQKSDGSSSSTNAVLKGMGVVADGFSIQSSSLDSRLVVGPNFAAGTDSENSEDRSSKSSTAASVPKLRHEVSARDKNRMRTPSGKNLVNSVQRGQQAKSRVETSKKHRGERVKVEKENSHSSMESDSRSSNFVFMQGTDTVTSNGRQNGRSVDYDGEISDEAQDGEQHLEKEPRTGYSKENVGEFETLSNEDLAAELSWEVKEEKVENHRSSTDQDPLVASIHTLQSAQEELEKELQKLREIGTENISLSDGSTQGTSLPSEFASAEASLSDLLQSGGTTQISSDSLETQIVSLKQNVNLLESKLEAANSKLKLKDAKVLELEYALKSNESPKDEIESKLKKYTEMEAELEGLFKQKIEAEVEYLAISKTIQKLRVATVDQVELFEEQKTLASEQAEMLNELGEVESKAKMLKRQAEKLETRYEDIVETAQVLELQKSVCKVTSCIFMQLILLVIVFVFFLQLSPRYEGVVPT